MPKRHFGRTTWLCPLPTLLVAVRSGPTSANIITLVWGGVASGNPPTIALGVGAMHHSAGLIETAGDFTVNIPRASQAAGVDYCGIVSGRDDPNKAASCGWTLTPSEVISSPYIEECPINLECKLVDRIVRRTNATYLGEVVATHVDEALLDAQGRPDARLIDPLLWAPDGHYYRLGDVVGREHELGGALKR